MAWSLQTLVRSPWLSRQPAPVARTLLDLGRVYRFEAGQQLLAGEGGLFAVVQGRVALYADAGRAPPVLVDLLHAGAWLGLTAPDGDGRTPLIARARNAVALFLIPDAQLARLGRSRSDVWQSIAALAYAQHGEAVATIARLLTADPAQLIALRLVALREGRPPFVAVSQTELGELCGLTRKAINAHLGAMEEGGLVRRAYGRVDLLDLPALRRLASG